jgi:hypothetical protein
MKTIYILLLLVVIIIATLVIQKMNSSIEPFKVDINLVQPKTCPHKMQSYIDGKTQQTVCCDGTVKENVCSGLSVCTLTPSAASNLIGCAQYLKDYNTKMQAKHCLNEMSRYYEDASQEPNISGCASQVNGDESAPVLNAKSCRIYKDDKDNTNKVDSCVNAKLKYDLQNGSFCKMVNCASNIVRYGGTPPLVSGTYGSAAGGTPLTCYSKETLKRYVKYAFSGDRLTDELNAIDNGTNTQVCGYVPPCNKKAFYVRIYGKGYLQISQIVIRDANGRNIANGAKVYASPPYNPQSVAENAVDGNEKVRAYPNIYHSKNNKDAIFIVELKTPACISQIIIYGRSDCCTDRNEGNKIVIEGDMDKDTKRIILWTSPDTTKDLVQTFNIPSSVYV